MSSNYAIPQRSSKLASSFTMWSIAMFLGAVVMGGCVFAVTQAAQQHEASIETMNHDIVSERQSIRVLEAEWAYLTRPQRLEELMAMKENTEDMPPAPAPIATMLPEDNAAVAPVLDVVPAAAPLEAKTEPAAGTSKVAEPKKIARVEPAVKKEAVKVKTVSAPVKTKAKAATSNDVWPIAKKSQMARVQPRAVPVYRSTPVSTRSSRQIARPILE